MGKKTPTFPQQGAWPGFEDTCKTRSHQDFGQSVPLPAKERPNLAPDPLLPAHLPHTLQGSEDVAAPALKLLNLFCFLNCKRAPCFQDKLRFFFLPGSMFNFSTFAQMSNAEPQTPFPIPSNPAKPPTACALAFAFVHTTTHRSLKSPRRPSPSSYIHPKTKKRSHDGNDQRGNTVWRCGGDGDPPRWLPPR